MIVTYELDVKLTYDSNDDIMQIRLKDRSQFQEKRNVVLRFPVFRGVFKSLNGDLFISQSDGQFAHNDSVKFLVGEVMFNLFVCQFDR